MHIMLHSNSNLYTSIVYEKKACHLNINRNKLVMKISIMLGQLQIGFRNRTEQSTLANSIEQYKSKA